MKRAVLLLAASLGLIAWACPQETQWQIEMEIRKSLEATRTENIADYMATIPADFALRQDDGSLLDAEGMREDVLRQWSLVEQTNLIETTIEKMERNRDGSVTVWTSGRWDRIMIGRDGVSRHRVVTTQKHREVWRRRGVRWFVYEIEELGGQLWIDGRLQS